MPLEKKKKKPTSVDCVGAIDVIALLLLNTDLFDWLMFYSVFCY